MNSKLSVCTLLEVALSLASAGVSATGAVFGNGLAGAVRDAGA